MRPAELSAAGRVALASWTAAGLRAALRVLAAVADMLRRPRAGLHVIAAPSAPDVAAELQARLAFYAPGTPWHAAPPAALTRAPQLVFDREPRGVLDRLRANRYFIDWRRYANDGYEWCRLAHDLAGVEVTVAIATGRQRLLERFDRIARELPGAPAYGFGTGPSLATAAARPWHDGVRIVCNTIVRDRALWHHIAPHFVVAGDAIYHFGHNLHSAAFRADLIARLQESDTLFLYPSIFHGVVARQLSAVASQLVPIPRGRHHDVFASLRRRATLPQAGNVLNLLILPVAATLSRDIRLCGFDGRDPQAKLFWRNSGGQSYPELMGDIQRHHPAFFAHYVPAHDPNRYVRDYHGEELDRQLSSAERRGFSIELLHPSWTGTLQKRYRGPLELRRYYEELLGRGAN